MKQEKTQLILNSLNSKSDEGAGEILCGVIEKSFYEDDSLKESFEVRKLDKSDPPRITIDDWNNSSVKVASVNPWGTDLNEFTGTKFRILDLNEISSVINLNRFISVSELEDKINETVNTLKAKDFQDGMSVVEVSGKEDKFAKFNYPLEFKVLSNGDDEVSFEFTLKTGYIVY